MKGKGKKKEQPGMGKYFLVIGLFLSLVLVGAFYYVDFVFGIVVSLKHIFGMLYVHLSFHPCIRPCIHPSVNSSVHA